MAHFGEPLLDDVFRYWLSRRRDGKPPRRADIVPRQLGAALPQINLLDVIREPGRPLQFRHRLVGTGINDWLSRDATGEMVDEALYGDAAREIVATLSRIVETALPYRRVARLDRSGQQFALMEAVELPLSDDSHDVAMILRCACYRPVSAGDPAPLFEPLPLTEG